VSGEPLKGVAIRTFFRSLLRFGGLKQR